MKFPGDFTVEIIQNGTVPLEIYFSGIILSIISFFLSLIEIHASIDYLPRQTPQEIGTPTASEECS